MRRSTSHPLDAPTRCGSVTGRFLVQNTPDGILARDKGTFPLSANSLADLFPQVYQRAGIVGASSHSGRRWFMTELARAGVHPRIIQQRAGHSSLATTQRYIEVTPDQERKAVRAIRL